MHRHFTDFDAFLAELVLAHLAHLGDRATELRQAAGSRTVVANLTEAVIDLFGPVTAALIRLVIARDELRRRLRQARPSGLPIATEVTGMISDYLAAERDLGRIAADADLATLAPTLVGAASLSFTDRESGPPDVAAVGRMVATVLAGVTPG
ncbi:hypothetical protein GCM10012279_15270 [Micromonospora yangpuensis]|nr:hypothetical protein GCM10012279_15270 [Micromonospora yangpuensis]